MSDKAKSVNGTFKISKQSFRQKININYEWTVNIKAHDRDGDQLHLWRLKSTYTHFNYYWFLSLNGHVVNKNLKYEKCSCQVEVFNNQKKVTIRKENMKGPNFNEFYFTYMYYIGAEQCASLNKEIEILITFTTCDEKTLIEGEKALLDNGILTDTIIKTMDQEFPCHKFVLASRSEYFMKMFQTDMMESRTNTVNWTAVFDASVVKDLLHFLYTGQQPPNIVENHFALLEAAHLCLLPDLKRMCADSIRRNISVQNAAYVLQSAEIYESNWLKREAVKFVVAHWNDVFVTNFYQQLEPGLCKRLLNSIFEMLAKKDLNDN